MADPLLRYRIIFGVFALLVGASVGSFLNVCIYRLPLELAINKPRRSFCPNCKTPIPWHRNIPLVSWLWLRGRCANCGAWISFRYFAVELLTAILFLAIWIAFPFPRTVAYWIFSSLLIVATFIDFEHFIIPDEITIGGVVAGVLATAIIPELMNANTRLAGVIRSGLAALLGYVLLWFVLEAGKFAFGKKRIRLDAPTPFKWTRKGDDADFVVGEEASLWSEYFARETDRLLMNCDNVEIDGRQHNYITVEFHYDRVTIENEEFPLDHIDRISGIVRELQIPREAMGRGDLKFLAAIGAFLGWRGVLFSVFAGSLTGSVVGLFTMLIGRRVWSAKLPFGPYLAFGALVWMFAGPQLVRWYFSVMNP